MDLSPEHFLNRSARQKSREENLAGGLRKTRSGLKRKPIWLGTILASFPPLEDGQEFATGAMSRTRLPKGNFDSFGSRTLETFVSRRKRSEQNAHEGATSTNGLPT